jgi:hypothetical protein
MRFPIRLIPLVAVLAFPLAAQEEAPDTTKGRFGIGVAIGPSSLVLTDDFSLPPIGISNLMVSFRPSPGLTIEPELGILRTSQSAGGQSFSFTNTRIGVGFLAMMTERESIVPYLGTRFGINRTSSEQSLPGGPSQTSKQSGWYISAVFGAQHFFSHFFSLGGELQLTRFDQGEPSPNISGEPGRDLTSTSALAIGRWYF